ncbi:MAG: 3-dehydroquinate synthase [candidate division KSB1 bacterium]|nr:3-dehydroquinate synthase [candidate division KSB1 bacterium]
MWRSSIATMGAFEVKIGTLAYPVWVEPGAFQHLAQLVVPHLSGPQVALVSDSNVAPRYAPLVSEQLQNAGLEVHTLVLPAGERSKSLRRCVSVWGKLLEWRFDRSATIVALGGGVIGDLAGFVAATFLRGVALVQLPTTLLAQVDSAVGGKTGINHPAGKNAIGAFHHPRCVVSDPSVLSTLNRRDLRAGFAEVLKYAVIAHPQLFHVLEEKLDILLSLKEKELLSWVIQECCQIKARIVRVDERENGIRRVLNFGHTVGHALEAATGFKTFRHGEAVLLGMRAAAWISAQRGLLSEDRYKQVDALLARLPCAVRTAGIDPDLVLRFVASDKKYVARIMHFVALRDVGWPHVVTDLRAEELRGAIAHVLA